MLQVVKLLTSIDEKLGKKDCVDEKKDSFLRELEERIKALEASEHER